MCLCCRFASGTHHRQMGQEPVPAPAHAATSLLPTPMGASPLYTWQEDSDTASYSSSGALGFEQTLGTLQSTPVSTRAGKVSAGGVVPPPPGDFQREWKGRRERETETWM